MWYGWGQKGRRPTASRIWRVSTILTSIHHQGWRTTIGRMEVTLNYLIRFFSGFRISDLFSSFPDFPFFQFNIKATSFGSATLLDKHGQCMHPGSLWGSIWARRLPTRNRVARESSCRKKDPSWAANPFLPQGHRILFTDSNFSSTFFLFSCFQLSKSLTFIVFYFIEGTWTDRLDVPAQHPEGAVAMEITEIETDIVKA